MKSMRNIAFGALLVVALYCVVRVLLPDRQVVPPAGPPSTEVHAKPDPLGPDRRCVRPSRAWQPGRPGRGCLPRSARAAHQYTPGGAREI